jgi:hypothetical protein
MGKRSTTADPVTAVFVDAFAVVGARRDDVEMELIIGSETTGCRSGNVMGARAAGVKIGAGAVRMRPAVGSKGGRGCGVRSPAIRVLIAAARLSCRDFLSKGASEAVVVAGLLLLIGCR